MHQVIDAKEDMRDCQREVIESVKRSNPAPSFRLLSWSPKPEARSLTREAYFPEFSPSLYMYLIAGL